MLIKGFDDLKKYIDRKVPKKFNAEVCDRVLDQIYHDKNRPSFGDNWRQYLDSLPADLVQILPYSY
jgi:hypothetical protein